MKLIGLMSQLKGAKYSAIVEWAKQNLEGFETKRDLTQDQIAALKAQFGGAPSNAASSGGGLATVNGALVSCLTQQVQLFDSEMQRVEQVIAGQIQSRFQQVLPNAATRAMRAVQDDIRACQQAQDDSFLHELQMSLDGHSVAALEGSDD